MRYCGPAEGLSPAHHYNRHRHYDPTLGRYISADPIGQFGSLVANRVADPSIIFSLAITNHLVSDVPFADVIPEATARENLYSYSLNQPTRIVDPLGLQGIYPVDLSPRTRAAFAAGMLADPRA